MQTGWKEKDDHTIGEIRAALERERLDAFIPWKTPHVGYLTNYYDFLHINILWEELVAILVIPRQSDAFIVGIHEHWAGYEAFGVAPWWLAGRHSAAGGAEAVLRRVAEILVEKKLDTGRIGIEKKWMPVAVYDHLRRILPEAELVSADLLVPQIRFIKTKREHLLLKAAAESGLRAMEAYMRAIRLGATHRHAEVNRAQRALDYGAEWVGGPYRIAWTGGPDYTPAWWDDPARRQFDTSEIGKEWAALLDASGSNSCFVTHFETQFQRYFGDMAWHEFYGPEPDEDQAFTFNGQQVSYRDLRRDFEVIRRVQTEALHAIRPGMDHVQAQQMVDEYLASDAEAREHITHYYVHGVGLEIHEEPVLVRGSRPVPLDGPIYFQPGAVVSSEWFSRYWTVEEPFVMTQTGWEPLVELKGIVSPQ